MNEKKPQNEEQVERLVRDHLLREAETVDAAGILAGVRARSAARTPATTPAASRIARLTPAARWAGRAALVTAATVLFAVLWALPISAPHASAEILVREARQAHTRPLELCYLHVFSPPQAPEGDNGLPLPPEGKLWTRGDRFFMETVLPNGKINALGRDAQGRVWFAPHPFAGFRFEAHEVPEPLARQSDMRSMNVDKLLTDVLAHFDLHKKEAGPGLQVVEAQAKADRPFQPLRRVRLEIDTHRKLLRKVEIQRRHPHGLSQTTFTLVENAPPREDAKYTLEGHLAEGAQVFSMEQPPPMRYKMLYKHYEMGRRAGPDFPKP